MVLAIFKQFDGLTGDLVKTELRSGNVYTSRQVVRFITPVLKWYRKNFPYKLLIIRGDSGFANPRLYENAEEHSYTFIFTDMDLPPRDVIRFYSNRGTMENFIKEVKTGFGMGTLNHTKFLANANKMWQMLLAYNLNNFMRRLCMPAKSKTYRIETLRTKVIKIASRFITSARYKILKLCNSCPYQNLFWEIFNRIERLPSFG